MQSNEAPIVPKKRGRKPKAGPLKEDEATTITMAKDDANVFKGIALMKSMTIKDFFDSLARKLGE